MVRAGACRGDGLTVAKEQHDWAEASEGGCGIAGELGGSRLPELSDG